jgi:hypothetical protein
VPELRTAACDVGVDHCWQDEFNSISVWISGRAVARNL